MKPETRSKRLLAITRSKGKMYELGVEESDHVQIPEGIHPSQLLVMAIASVGDIAASFIELEEEEWNTLNDLQSDVSFSATYFDAFLQSQLGREVSDEVSVLASAAYYLAERPGSSFVVSRGLSQNVGDSDPTLLLKWILRADWESTLQPSESELGKEILRIANLVQGHFLNGDPPDSTISKFQEYRSTAYAILPPRDLLHADLSFAILKKRIASSAWILLPKFTFIDKEHWNTTIKRKDFPKELWPSQVKLGTSGFFSGTSGIVQMPTSAGKTRSIEIILRSAFLSRRAKIAVVVAPFRALCHEINNSLRNSFSGEEIVINELSDVLEVDQLIEIQAGRDQVELSTVLVLTPEKFLYILRQSQQIVNLIGLLIYDEGHQFDSGARGITYELLLTEIKELVAEEVQTILISAVIQNAQAVAEWLLGQNGYVASGVGLLPTSRSVAFPSWKTEVGRLNFYDNGIYGVPDYYVPKVIESQPLQLKNRERIQKVFPQKGKTSQIALYLGLRLARSGAVAIFCGTKIIANSILKHANDVFSRGLRLAPPIVYSNQIEVSRLTYLFDLDFGQNSEQSRAAKLGIFIHHAGIPHGIRIAVEHAMHRSLIKFVICTSTLAQGVNMPIRYLVVANTTQGTEPLKVRDFQNLIGRAGRSGMHTEGLVVFSDVEAYDTRQNNSYYFDLSVKLLNPELSELTSSSLLELVSPFESVDGFEELRLSPTDFALLLLSDESAQSEWAENLANQSSSFEADKILNVLRSRRKLLTSLESYLMANRGVSTDAEFLESAEQLATRTLGYFLADEETKPYLVQLFRQTANYLEIHSQDELAQERYSKTLLGIESSVQIETWVVDNLRQTSGEPGTQEWLELLWEIIVLMNDDRMISDVEPTDTAKQLARAWIEGKSYGSLFSLAENIGATKPLGERRRTAVTHEDILSYLETTLGYEVSLIVAAVGQTIELIPLPPETIKSYRFFQKVLKYGLPEQLMCRCFEAGFADRELAKQMSRLLLSLGISEDNFEEGLSNHRADVRIFLEPFPEYFHLVLKGITR